MVRRALILAAALAGCGDLQGLDDVSTPLARVPVVVEGDDAAVAHLRVAIVWGAQRLPEPFCFLPAESPEAQAVIDAGCRDNFGFTPDLVDAGAVVTPGVPAMIDLFTLPPADVLVGDVTARIGYASLVAYDDVDQSGTLELGRATPAGGFDPEDTPPSIDVVYGASFISMTLPDQRLAFREGVFNAAAAFYPRAGCPDPPVGFSTVAAGGFSEADAFASLLTGMLPAEDPATCAQAALPESMIAVPLVDPAGVAEVGCRARRLGGGTRYREAPADSLDLVNRVWACVGLPSLGDDPPPDLTQLVIAGPPGDVCPSVQHYTLRGCEDDAACETPEWDFAATPPAWWPCP